MLRQDSTAAPESEAKAMQQRRLAQLHAKAKNVSDVWIKYVTIDDKVIDI